MTAIFIMNCYFRMNHSDHWIAESTELRTFKSDAAQKSSVKLTFTRWIINPNETSISTFLNFRFAVRRAALRGAWWLRRPSESILFQKTFQCIVGYNRRFSTPIGLIWIRVDVVLPGRLNHRRLS